MNRHRVSAGMFAALAEGSGGAGAIRHLAAAEHSRRLLFIRGVLMMARESEHPQYGLARDAYDLLADIQRHAEGAVDDILRYPSVGAWAGRALLAQGIAWRPGYGSLAVESADAAEPAGLAAVAASAAIKARFPCSILVPATAGVVTFPAVGQATVADREKMAVLRCGPGGAELLAGRFRVTIPEDPQADGPGWRGLRQISARSRGATLRLVVDDLDPHRMRAPSLAGRLTRAQVTRWESALRAAWEILRAYHQAMAEEIAEATRVLVPLQPPGHGIRSATSREHFGCAGISAPPHATALAVSLAHEVQHAKLSALQNLIRLTLPDDGRRYYAPWRDDPRPASGLFQGAYAYLGVTRFWRRQRYASSGDHAFRAHAEYARWRSAVVSVLGVLGESGRLTGAGQEFVSRMTATMRGWEEDPVPPEAAEAACRAAARHAERWRLRNAPPR